MTEKKSNFLPLLLIGGGLAGAALLYGFGTKQSKEDYSLGGAVGVGGSGDFLGSSGINPPTVAPFPFYNISDIMKGFDSTDLGIEDYAYDRANPDAYTNPSEGGANPENVNDDSGVWSFADVAGLGITAALTAPALAKGAKSVGSKVGSVAKNVGTRVLISKAERSATSTAGKAATNTAGKATASTIAKSTLKKAGIIGGIATAVDILVGTASAPTPEYDTAAIRETASNISTDLAAKVGIGNMAYDNRQLKIASGLASTGSTYETITAEETRIVNEALGTTGDVIKQSYGSSGHSYIAAGGKQLSFAGTDLKTAASKVTTTKKTVPSTSDTRRKPASSTNSGSATTTSLSKLFGGK